MRKIPLLHMAREKFTGRKRSQPGACMEVQAFAKVNLALDVLGKREDGYHELDMVMAPVSLYDSLRIEQLDDAAAFDEIICENIVLPAENTLTRTLQVMREKAGLQHSYKITLKKRIPSQAGLGGGSADAAALIHALCRMENIDLSMEEKMEIGSRIGADVPYCLMGGFARVQGIGEKVQPIYTDWKIPVLLVKPEGGLSTPESFARYDAMENRSIDVDIVEDALRKQDIGLLYQTMANALESQALKALPELSGLREEMGDLGLVRVVMTGSGSCLMGFCIDEEVLDEAAGLLRTHYPFVEKAWIG